MYQINCATSKAEPKQILEDLSLRYFFNPLKCQYNQYFEPF